jgi:hypothetical protein
MNEQEHTLADMAPSELMKFREIGKAMECMNLTELDFKDGGGNRVGTLFLTHVEAGPHKISFFGVEAIRA